MPCTTILVGKKASVDGSTMIARNDDGRFDTKKLIVVDPSKQPKIYKNKSKLLTVELPDNPMRYTSTPNVTAKAGVWPANGINAANVGMTATETTTSNPRVMGADPYVKEGIGEEDLVLLVLPYIHSAREGVLRLGALLEQYGTYESNGIAFNDENEVWWLESIGGHHWMARRVKDEEYVIMPNQFGLDRFDFKDAFGDGKEDLCSKDLMDFIKKYRLSDEISDEINPRLIFGSHTDADHVYNTPRGWYMARYFNPRTYCWDGENADYTPESDDIPWALVPERKISPEEVKYILSSYYQGTPYNPYGRGNDPRKGIYRSIGINRTSVMAVLQIRSWVPDAIKGVEWICFASNAFNSMFPLYVNVPSFPKYFSGTTEEMDITRNLYWGSRYLGVLADVSYGTSIIHVERYQSSTMNQGRAILNHYDALFAESNDLVLLEKANKEVAEMAQKETNKTLRLVLQEASNGMKNGYHRFDN
ncbi:MAG: C69 family dipeptidase [Candidatus Enteromonas sp.]